MYCKYCGEKLSPEEKFCHNCGANVAAANEYSTASRLNIKKLLIVPAAIICIIVCIIIIRQNSSYKVIGREVGTITHNGVVVYDQNTDYSEKNFIEGDYLNAKGKLRWEEHVSDYNGQTISGYVVKLKEPIQYEGVTVKEIQLFGNSFEQYVGDNVSIVGELAQAPSVYYVSNVILIPCE